jgi:uncharacterized membrane protein
MAKTKLKPDHVMGRPQANIDLVLVDKLAKIQCTITEISAIIDVPVSTLTSREDFSLTYKKGIEGGKMSLRRLQFKIAQKSAAMAIFLGKQYLGQKDKVEVDPGDLFKGDIEFKDPIDKSRVSQFLNN